MLFNTLKVEMQGIFEYSMLTLLNNKRIYPRTLSIQIFKLSLIFV